MRIAEPAEPQPFSSSWTTRSWSADAGAVISYAFGAHVVSLFGHQSMTTSHPMPPAVREYLERCGNEARLVAWWQRDHPRDPHEALWVITYSVRTEWFTVVSFPVEVSHWSHQLYGSAYREGQLRDQCRAGLWAAPEASRSATEAFLDSLEAGIGDSPALS